jgi:uncharacterized protein (TIGR02246 family)
VFLTCTVAGVIAQMQRGSAADEAAIRQLAKDYASAWNSGDAAKAAAVHTDDAVFINVRGMVMTGRAAIEKSLAADLSGELKGSMFAVTVDTIQFIRPDVALLNGTMNITGGATSPDGRKGHYLVVATQQGGAWKVAAVHAAAMPPPPKAWAGTISEEP